MAVNCGPVNPEGYVAVCPNCGPQDKGVFDAIGGDWLCPVSGCKYRLEVIKEGYWSDFEDMAEQIMDAAYGINAQLDELRGKVRDLEDISSHATDVFMDNNEYLKVLLDCGV